jgi:hypothetical protein
MSDDAAIREALSDPVYRAAFVRTLSGEEDLWTEEEREAVRRAKEVTGHKGPGYPVPTAE